MNLASSALEIKTGSGFMPTGVENFNPGNAYISVVSAGIAAATAAEAFSVREQSPVSPENEAQ